MPIIRQIVRNFRVKTLFGNGPNARGGVCLQHERADVALHIVAPVKFAREIHVKPLVLHVVEGFLECEAIGVKVRPFLNQVGSSEFEDS